MTKHAKPNSSVLLLFLIFVVLFSGSSIAKDISIPNGAPVYWNGQPRNEVYGAIRNYIGSDFVANYFYQGKLVYQVEDGLGAGPYITRKIGHDIYLLGGFRYQDGSAQSAVIVTGSGHVLLAAIGSELYQCASTTGSKPLMAVFVRDPKNLQYLPALKAWAASYCKKYTVHVYNLNCKAGKTKKPLITNCPMKQPTTFHGTSAK